MFYIRAPVVGNTPGTGVRSPAMDTIFWAGVGLVLSAIGGIVGGLSWLLLCALVALPVFVLRKWWRG